MNSSRTSGTNAGQNAASSGLGGQADISASAAPPLSRSSSRISAAAGLATLPSLRHSVSGAGGGETARSLSQQYGMAPQQPVPGSSRAGTWRESLGAGGGSGPSANKQASESAYNGYVQEGTRGESSRASTVGKSKESETLHEDWRHNMRRSSEVGHVDSWGNAYTHSEIEANNMIHIRTSDGTSDMRGGEYIDYYKKRGSISADRPVTQETYDKDQERVSALLDAGDPELMSAEAKYGRRWWWRVSEKDFEQRMAKLNGGEE